jgi:hypothetical protein
VTGYFGHVHPDDFEKIIATHQLQHWVKVLFETKRKIALLCDNNGTRIAVYGQHFQFPEVNIEVDLTTGQPAAEADYQAFNQIVGI